MAKTAKIMVACGSGIATSMQVVSVLREKLEAEKLDASIDSCSVNELQFRTGGYDIIVSTAQVAFDVDQVVFNAVPILTGIGEEELLANIIATVKKINQE